MMILVVDYINLCVVIVGVEFSFDSGDEFVIFIGEIIIILKIDVIEDGLLEFVEYFDVVFIVVINSSCINNVLVMMIVGVCSIIYVVQFMFLMYDNIND